MHRAPSLHAALTHSYFYCTSRDKIMRRLGMCQPPSSVGSPGEQGRQNEIQKQEMGASMEPGGMFPK